MNDKTDRNDWSTRQIRTVTAEDSHDTGHDNRDDGPAQRSYRTILKQQIVTGLLQIRRPTLGLFLSSISAGLDIGFSLLLMAVVLTMFGESNAGAPLTRLLVANMYAIGFVLVILGRSELFTEHTALAVLPVLDHRSTLTELARVWGTVYAGNMVGATAFACLTYWVGPALKIVDEWSLRWIAGHMLDHPWWVILLSGVLAGWLMGELAWIIGAARDTISQVVFVWLVTAAIGLAQLHHVVAGAAEVLAGILASETIPWTEFLRFLAAATLGNALGGVFFVAIIKYGHAVHSTPEPDEDEA